MLTAIADGVATTGALARRLGISSAAVSQHTAVLREAGLITTRRHHGNVLHNPTQTGLALLDRPYALPGGHVPTGLSRSSAPGGAAATRS
ncbi:helix-turn-helix domain-containing protein [Nonomuraea sp. NPDC050691]|uniref:ArsR/SmtB family transcription factor n=1 Tax=Nonomuraea sp. NPDC050691 TaxID=3155661 RepID=UPI0033CD9F21